MWLYNNFEPVTVELPFLPVVSKISWLEFIFYQSLTREETLLIPLHNLSSASVCCCFCTLVEWRAILDIRVQLLMLHYLHAKQTLRSGDREGPIQSFVGPRYVHQYHHQWYVHEQLQYMFNGLLSRTTRVSWHQKGKQFWILMKQEIMG